ncbi:MAG: PAS domain-containing protein, partial [Rhodanobacter sp.]
MEFRLRNAAGEYRWHLARALPLRASSGEITRWVGTNTDIHERKLSEVQSLRDRNRMWALSQELMVIADLQGALVAVNPTAARVLGWPEAEMIGRSVTDFVHPDDVATTAAEMGRLGHSGATLAFENRWRCRDGEYRTFDWTAVPDGGQIHAVGRDVTGQRAAEEALRHAQKMEAVGQLTGGLAHDFNNLLGGIMGAMEVAQIKLDQGKVEDIPRYLSIGETAVRRAASLTQRLLAFSRQQTLDPRSTDINRLVAGMEDLIRRTIGPSVDLEVVGAGGIWPSLVDPPQLENALLNLCINARDAMPDGGRLTIETANRSLDEYAAAACELEPGQYVALSVTDTGIGMSADVIARAFDPFFTTKPIGQGTGLGLSMIYGFARQSGGQARIYSEPGAGSTVCLYLPRHHEAPVDAEATTPPRSPRVTQQQETILVVEDEPSIRELVCEILAGIGYTVLQAGDGKAGLHVLQSTATIDLLITDVGLPGAMNGRQMADIARTTRPQLKILFMTGYAENSVVGNGHLEHDMHLLTKPFSLQVLKRKIHELLPG